MLITLCAQAIQLSVCSGYHMNISYFATEVKLRTCNKLHVHKKVYFLRIINIEYMYHVTEEFFLSKHALIEG